MQAPTASEIMVVESSVHRTASAAGENPRERAGARGAEIDEGLEPAVRLAAMAASASPMKAPERREVVASQRMPCSRWASRRNRVSCSQSSADSGRRRSCRRSARRRGQAGGRGRSARRRPPPGRPHRSARAAGRPGGWAPGQAVERDQHERHVLGRQPAQPPAEDVRRAQHLGGSGVGSERLAACGYHDVGRWQLARADAVAEAQEAPRVYPRVRELQQRPRRDEEPPLHLQPGRAPGRSRASAATTPSA